MTERDRLARVSCMTRRLARVSCTTRPLSPPRHANPRPQTEPNIERLFQYGPGLHAHEFWM